MPAVNFKKNREQDYIDTPYPMGESYKNVEHRIQSFLSDLGHLNFNHVAIVAHQAPQLALDVLLKSQTWDEAIANDWRKTQSWQPGWEYSLG